MHERACCQNEAANHQLSIAAAFWIIQSFHGGPFELNAKSDANALLYSFSHFECNGHTVQTLTQQHPPPHWLIQWSCHCSRMGIPIHSQLPCCTDVAKTLLIILTTAGIFSDRPHILIIEYYWAIYAKWIQRIPNLWEWLHVWMKNGLWNKHENFGAGGTYGRPDKLSDPK